jgi:ATP-binding protein involved in chromosome partitioning
VDMPPGTGDAQLTLVQRVPLAGAVIVSTPQEIALIDARRGLKMFETTHVPILGVIENMSYFLSPDSGVKHYIFGQGGARATAEKYGCDFLGEIPLQQTIRETSDAGTPIVASQPDSAEAQIYLDIAGRIIRKLDASRIAPGRSAPRIVIE